MQESTNSGVWKYGSNCVSKEDSTYCSIWSTFLQKENIKP